MPTLSITPESTADTCEGAAACAPGSQKWSGTAPALSPKPTSARPSATVRAAPGDRLPRPSSVKEWPVAFTLSAANMPMRARVLRWVSMM